MKMKIDLSALDMLREKISLQEVAVGVPPEKTAAIPKRATKARTQGLTHRKRSPVQSKIPLHKVLGWLEARRGVLSRAIQKANKQQVRRVAELFCDIGMNEKTTSPKIKQLERLCADLVIDPIAHRRYGPNAKETVEEKGFDHFGVDTSTLIKSIRGKYRRA